LSTLRLLTLFCVGHRYLSNYSVKIFLGNKHQFRLDQFNYSGVFEVSSLRMQDN
jgi:hypothetical protein